MRLGDLDTLKEDIVKLCRQINASNGITVPTLAFTRVIDNAPTVEINKWLDPDIDPELALENIRRIVYEQRFDKPFGS